MILRRTLSLLVCGVFVACAGREDVADASSDPPDEQSISSALADSLESRRDTIRAMVHDASASDSSHCRALPFGAKPCGGPWSYVVFSTEVTDSTALATLVEDYNRLEDLLNREEGRVSDCMFVERPTLALEGGQCVAAGSGLDEVRP